MAETHFDERIASPLRDELWPDLFDPAVVDPVVDCLADLAGRGAALEFGIGTGRIAMPLAGAASRCTVSTCRRPWSRDYGRSRARRVSA